MRLSLSIGLIALALCLSSAPAHAQYQPPSEQLMMQAHAARKWDRGGMHVIELSGNVSLDLQTAHLSARSAVIWITPSIGPDVQKKSADDDTEQEHIQIALIGAATVRQRGVTRSGDKLYVVAEVRGLIRLTTDDAPATQPADVPGDQHTPLYMDASELQQVAFADNTDLPGMAPRPEQRDTHSNRGTAAPTTQQATTKPVPTPLRFSAGNLETVDGPDGTVDVVLSNGVTLFQKRPNGDALELRADKVVLFTPLKNLRDVGKSEQIHRLEDAVTAAYLEGDVRMTYAPYSKVPEQRLSGERVYYDFTTDRAILTDAVLHTIDATRAIPVVIRARTMRQLAFGEYNNEKAQLTTSSFAVPSYSIAADRLYVRADEIPGPLGGERIVFRAQDATFRVFDNPVFYWPSLSGSMTDRGGALRSVEFVNQEGFGYGLETEWGLFETLGIAPPPDLDVGYQLDYFTDRGEALGMTAAYKGGFITDSTHQPWSFEGDFKGWAIYDKGTDDLGAFRRDVDQNPDGEQNLRGRFLWEHQHFFPDDWQLQLRLGYTSDATFREEFFQSEFDQELPLDMSAYIKHQRDTEAFTLLIDGQPSHVVTTADMAQEQFEVERLPEITYRRIGDSVADDHLTFFSDNSASGLHFQRSNATLEEQGYQPGTVVVPGIPSLGQTGVTGRDVYRANFRQELDYPFTIGQFKAVPYAMGIYTQYSDSPTGGAKARLLAGGGMRFTTAYWKTDPTAHSELFDIHQVRHVIEPELNLFTSAQTIRHDDVYMYDEDIDSVNDVSAAQIALHQRWQTKRGGPGQWRNVDFLTLDVDAEVFDNKPRKQFLNPLGFRGLYFSSLPEASVPRDAINANATWRLSDETVLIGDMSWNADKKELATAAIGILVRRGDRLDYYIENRYIDELDSNITSFHIDYQLNSKYVITLDQSFDFTLGTNVQSGVAVSRRFDTFIVLLAYNHDETTGTNGFSFQLSPAGTKEGLGSGQFQGGFRR